MVGEENRESGDDGNRSRGFRVGVDRFSEIGIVSNSLVFRRNSAQTMAARAGSDAVVMGSTRKPPDLFHNFSQLLANRWLKPISFRSLEPHSGLLDL